DERTVLLVALAAPLVAVAVLLGHLPEAERVVGEVVVQLDQPRIERPAGGDALDVLEAGGRSGVAGLRGDDAALLEEDGALREHAVLRVHGDDAPRQGQARAGQRIDDAGHARAQGMTPAGTVMAMLARLLCALSPTRRAQPSSAYIQAGVPAGRSKDGMSALSASVNASP